MLPIAVSCHRAHNKNIGTMMNAKKMMTSFARIAIDVGCSQGKSAEPRQKREPLSKKRNATPKLRRVSKKATCEGQARSVCEAIAPSSTENLVSVMEDGAVQWLLFYRGFGRFVGVF